MQRKLLLTGGAGFIGVNLVRYWLDTYPKDRVVVVDALTYAGCRASLPSESGHKEFTFVHGDIRDQSLIEKLLRHHEIETIVHLAAESHVDRSIAGPDQFIDTNIVGTHSLLKAARRVWLDERRLERHRFHHVSTDEVYGSLDAHDPPFTEMTPYAPNSPYAASKAASDHLVRAYAHTYGLKTTISNCSNNYGPYQFPEKLIPVVIINALHGKPLPVYGNGSNIRDWLYVEDHCRAIDLILARGKPGETYNIGANNERHNIDIVRSLCRMLDAAFQQSDALRERFPFCPAARGETCETLIQFVTDRLGHDWRYAVDATKARDALQYVPQCSWEDGIARTLDWYLSQEAWWRGITHH